MGKVKGDIRVLLSGERVALNYLQRMSGIATYTNSVANSGKKQDQTPRYKKNNTEYAYF